jgi:hypothetical protein
MSEVNPNQKQKDFISWLIDGALSMVFGRPAANPNTNANISQSYQSTYNNGYPPVNNGSKPGGCGCGMHKQK